MARFFADEDFPLDVVHELRLLTHDVLTVSEAGQAGKHDPEILAYAITDRRAVLTHNRRHFIRLHRTVSVQCGIVVCTRDQDWPALAKRIDQAVAAVPSLDNQLIRVYRPSVP